MRYLMIAAAACMAFYAAGCETSKGAGKDLENTGANIEQGINASTNAMNNTTDNTTTDTTGTGGADTGVGSGNNATGMY